MIFMELNCSLIQTIEKIIRYHYHVSLLCTYAKFNKIPKGFRLRFYSNFIDWDYNNILKHCCRKHIHRTISYHKQRLKQLGKTYKSLSQKIICEYPEKSYYVKSLLSTKHDKLHQDPVKRRHRKFLWDGMESSYVKEFCHETERKSLNGITGYFNDSVEHQQLFNINHHTIILTNDVSQIRPFLKDLCAKHPSFVPTPINYDWAQPQLDFDTFASRMRPRYIFRGKSSLPCNGSSMPYSPKKPSTWRASKRNSAELETFLSTVEKELLINIKRNYVKDNFTKDEGRSLTTWRIDILFNPDSNLLLRSQDKGNRFVVVDKQTDIVKANQEIGRSSFVKLNYETTKEFISNVKQWNQLNREIILPIFMLRLEKTRLCIKHKEHVSLTTCNWYFKWTPNIKSCKVSDPRYC